MRAEEYSAAQQAFDSSLVHYTAAHGEHAQETCECREWMGEGLPYVEDGGQMYAKKDWGLETVKRSTR